MSDNAEPAEQDNKSETSQPKDASEDTKPAEEPKEVAKPESSVR